MRKLSTAEKRERALQELARRKTATPTTADLHEARKAMNSYYRLCGLDEQLLYLQNDERTCNSRYTKEQEEKATKWVKRLNKYLAPFNARAVYFGYCPTICEVGTTQDLYLSHFYN